MSEIMDVPLPRAASSALINCERATDPRVREPRVIQGGAMASSRAYVAPQAAHTAAQLRRGAVAGPHVPGRRRVFCGRVGAGCRGDAMKTNTKLGEATRLRGLRATPPCEGGGAGSHIRRAPPSG